MKDQKSKSSSFKGIPVVRSGTKYRTDAGFSAIKNGVKARGDNREARYGTSRAGCAPGCRREPALPPFATRSGTTG
jgi:hypothetical protein